MITARRHPASAVLALAALLPAWAVAGIHTRTEAGGLVIISNQAPAGPALMEVAAPRVRPRLAAPAVSPAAYPRVSRDEQRARDADRRGILQEELDAERRALGAAQAGGSADQVRRHRVNIEALQRELMTVR